MTDQVSTLAAICQLQHAVNARSTGDDFWYQKSYPYYRKAWQEAAEIIDHLDDNWWKNTPFNEHQVRMEVVDIFHFLLSEAIMNVSAAYPNTSPEVVFSQVAAMFTRSQLATDPLLNKPIEQTAGEGLGKRYVYIHLAVEPFITVTIDYGRSLMHRTNIDGVFDAIRRPNSVQRLEDVISSFRRLVNATDMTFDDLIFWYCAKNALNLFRQNHGYKAGTYKKIWGTQEDNEYLAGMADDLKGLSHSEIIDGVTMRLADLYYEWFPEFKPEGYVRFSVDQENRQLYAPVNSATGGGVSMADTMGTGSYVENTERRALVLETDGEPSEEQLATIKGILEDKDKL